LRKVNNQKQAIGGILTGAASIEMKIYQVPVWHSRISVKLLKVKHKETGIAKSEMNYRKRSYKA